jgi:CheY-specific phosphatase CheX
MNEQTMRQLISEAVSSVLETMFFTAPFGLSEKIAGTSSIHVRVAFRGCPSGELDVCVSDTSARILASSFLGEDEETITDIQLGEVACEMSNMICGSLISRMESEQSFDLDSPRIILKENEIEESWTTCTLDRDCFEIEGGTLAVGLQLQAVS